MLLVKPKEPYSDYSTETTEDRRQWKDVFKLLKENYCYFKKLYTANISFKNEEEIQASEKKLREFSTRSPIAHQLPVTGLY